MKFLKSLILLILLTNPIFGITSYHIGNSLTNDGLGNYASTVYGIEAMADFYNQDLTLGLHIDSSQALHSIWNVPSGNGSGGIDVTKSPYNGWDNALANYQWDYVLLEPYLSQSATLGSDKATIDNFINYTRANPNNEDTIFYVYQVWPRQSFGNYTAYWESSSPNDDAYPTRPRKEFYRNLMDHLDETYTEQGIVTRMIPTGEVLSRLSLLADQFMLPNNLTMADFYRDDLHLSGLGRYVAAATIYSTIFQTDVRGLVPSSSHYNTDILTPETYQLINSVIWDVVASEPYSGIGDLNDDGYVNNADLTIIQNSFGIDAGGDTNGDGRTNGRDFLNWQRNFKDAPVTPMFTTVPEPNTFLILSSLALMCLSVSRICHNYNA